MQDWQQSFLQKLESAKRNWMHQFEDFAADHIEGVFCEFDDFVGKHGFNSAAPQCEAGTRLFKFELTENGYVMVAFRMRGLDRVEATAEFFVPGPGKPESMTSHMKMADAKAAWVRSQFEQALDRFVEAFGAAGSRKLVEAGA